VVQEPTPAGKVSRTKRRVAVLLMASTGLLLAGAGSAAFAVSGGGYSPNQQGCNNGDSDYATPNGATYAGCHTGQLNIESGQMNGGAPTPDNTRYVSVGVDQSPNDPNSQAIPGEYQVGLPGNSGSPHGFCAQANTDGTSHDPAATPQQQNQAIAADCKGNSAGTGFAENVDYYDFYCPIAAAAGNPCEDPGYGGSPGSGFDSLAPTIDQGTGQNLTPVLENGVIVYYGMDDNSDNGEHDGVGPFCDPTQPPPPATTSSKSNNGKHNGNPTTTTTTAPPNTQPAPTCQAGAANGSSDGGAIMLALTPLGVTNTPSQTNPEGVANLSLGACADGICTETTTQQQTVYHGCGANAEVTPTNGCTSPKNANVYDFAPGNNPNNDPSVNNESTSCNSGGANSTSTAACGPGGMDALREATPQNENTEPGVQVYSDPDPQRSPAVDGTPIDFLWPTPALYVGTCGVYAGSPKTTGQVLPANEAPGGQRVTNADSQVAIDPNPSVC
jgi:hypothetical protein